jgi:acetyltransferase
MRDLKRFLNPRSVAVIGASPDTTKVRGMAILRLLQSGFDGDIYPINPSHTEIAGFPAFPSVADLPIVPDLAILVVSSGLLVRALEECGRKGIKSAIVLSGLPAGPAGETIQQNLGQAARTYGIILLGPNALGYWNPGGRVAATFAPLIEDAASAARLTERHISIVSQSGGVGNSMYDKCANADIGVRYVLSLGNEADLHALEAIDWLIEEGGSRIICLYLEGFREPESFAGIASKAASRNVALVVIKAGQSAPGRRAAISHTGHMIGVDAAYDAMFERYGVLRVNDLEDMLAVTKALSGGRRLASAGIAIVSTGGGFAAMLADACVARGLTIPELDDALREKLSATIPEYGFASNPVDLPGGYLLEDKGVSLARILDDIAESSVLDGIILCFGLQAPGRVESMKPAIEPVLRRMTKPVLFHSPTLMARDNRKALAEMGVHDYSVAECALALAALRRHAVFRERWARKKPSPPARRETACAASWCFEATLARLQRHGILVPQQALVHSADEAVRAAAGFGCPVALKLQSPDLPHKTEAGGVRLDLRDEASIRAGFADLYAEVARKAPKARIDGILAQAMAPKGVELAIGVIRDADFGPLLTLSAGGVLIEILQDSVCAPLPVDEEDALAMIGRLKSAPALGPVLGGPPADVAALATLIQKVSGLFETAGNTLQEIEFNPVIVHPQGEGVSVVDVLVVERAVAEMAAHASEAA